MGMGNPALGIISLVVAAAFLVWVYEKNGNPAQKFGKFAAWFGVIVALLLVIGQLFMCYKACQSGQCMRMGKGQGMMMPHMMQNMEMPEDRTEK
ncbi:MAG: hypothetical protein HYT75_03950 [Deltaproteobacteria bacterium]|nr:hypothetical protein [Deltaproteobacteria bacterium]MBI2342556.1 hypothetical protein [Deltaproteobacteria bacterium]